MWLLLNYINFQLQVRSAAAALSHEESKLSGTGHKVTETGRRIDPSIVTERRNAHKSYSQAVETNIPQQPQIAPVSKIKHKKGNKICQYCIVLN